MANILLVARKLASARRVQSVGRRGRRWRRPKQRDWAPLLLAGVFPSFPQRTLRAGAVADTQPRLIWVSSLKNLDLHHLKQRPAAA